MPHFVETITIGNLIVAGSILGVGIAAMRKASRTMVTIYHLIEDVVGAPARPGVPEKPGIMVRMAKIELQLVEIDNAIYALKRERTHNEIPDHPAV